MEMLSRHTPLAKALNDLSPTNRAELIRRLERAQPGQTIRAGDVQITIGDDGESLEIAPAQPLMKKSASTGAPKLSFGDALMGLYYQSGGE